MSTRFPNWLAASRLWTCRLEIISLRSFHRGNKKKLTCPLDLHALGCNGNNPEEKCEA